MNSRTTLGVMVLAAVVGAACSSQNSLAESSKAGSGGGRGADADAANAGGAAGLAESSEAGSGGGGGAGVDAADAGATGLGANTDSGIPPELLEAYCDMEVQCIPQCLCGGGELCGCGSPARVAECARDVRRWGPLTQGAPCIATFGAWLECITQLGSCEQVQEFFAAHPDGVTTKTPCGSEYLDMDCSDFEPLTEYSF
jgi:hypothetical protein